MQTITKYIVLVVLILNAHLINAQETENNKAKIEILENAKQKVEIEERDYLKVEVEEVNKRMDTGDITQQEADKLKQELAEKRALNIENRTAIIDNKISLLKRNENGYSNDVDEGDVIGFSIGGREGTFAGVRINGKNIPRRYDRRTTNDFVFAIGFNNAIIDGESLNDSPYKLAGSGFVEMGWAWKTRVFKNTNAVRLKYGFSFQWNKLDIKDNLYFNEVDDVVMLEEFPHNVIKSKFRTTNLVFPVHFEFGPSKKIEHDNYFRYSTHKKFKIGVGAYGGFVLQSMQKIKYKENGDREKDKYKGFNTNNFVYGLSTYFGWGNVGIYAKYDLSPIFKDQTIDQNNISLGIRFDMD